MSNISIALSVFKFENHSIRLIVRNDQPWFVAADICKAIEIGNPTKALRALGDDEQALTLIQGISKGNDSVNIVNESGMYTLILRCRNAVISGTAPYRFRRWVTTEVLPAIRKTGKFDVKTNSGPLTKEMRETIKKLVIERAKVLPHEKQAGAIIKAWSALKSHFGVSYKEIPVEKYTEAISLVARMQVEWEVVEDTPEVKASYHYPLEAASPHDRFCASACLSPSNLLDPRNRMLPLELIAQLKKDGHDVAGAEIQIKAMIQAMEYAEMARRQMGSWLVRLKGLQYEVANYCEERGLNVVFVNKPMPHNLINQATSAE
jgi:prophage antirepressor-like protein